MKTWTAKLGFFAILTLLAGCATGNFDPNLAVEKRELGEIYDCYMAYLKTHEGPPTEPDQFQPPEAGYPAASRALREGKYKVVWGVKDKSGSTILAHEPDAADKGGIVLMADGTVRSMSAAEFRSAMPTK